MILAALYSLREPNRVGTGALWGLAGFAVFCLAPTLGLPPELPGTAAAELGQRQSWWVGTAAATALGLAMLVFARHWLLKVAGAALLVVPHVIGAPQPEVHQSLAPETLEAQFKIASWVTNAVFWLAWACSVPGSTAAPDTPDDPRYTAAGAVCRLRLPSRLPGRCPRQPVAPVPVQPGTAAGRLARHCQHQPEGR